jgi:hypothetical protein
MPSIDTNVNKHQISLGAHDVQNCEKRASISSSEELLEYDKVDNDKWVRLQALYLIQQEHFCFHLSYTLNFIPLGTKESLDKMYGNHIVIMFS